MNPSVQSNHRQRVIMQITDYISGIPVDTIEDFSQLVHGLNNLVVQLEPQDSSCPTIEPSTELSGIEQHIELIDEYLDPAMGYTTLEDREWILPVIRHRIEYFERLTDDNKADYIREQQQRATLIAEQRARVAAAQTPAAGTQAHVDTEEDAVRALARWYDREEARQEQELAADLSDDDESLSNEVEAEQPHESTRDLTDDDESSLDSEASQTAAQVQRGDFFDFINQIDNSAINTSITNFSRSIDLNRYISNYNSLNSIHDNINNTNYNIQPNINYTYLSQHEIINPPNYRSLIVNSPIRSREHRISNLYGIEPPRFSIETLIRDNLVPSQLSLPRLFASSFFTHRSNLRAALSQLRNTSPASESSEDDAPSPRQRMG